MKVTKIDTRQGTDNSWSFSNGNCLPLTGVPFGMNYFAPQTNFQNGSWWFNPRDPIFQGIRLTHQPSPWMGDFSYLSLLPINGKLNGVTISDAQSSYRSENAIFQPHFLEITALRYGYQARFSPSMYGGTLQVDYKQEEAGLFLHLPKRYVFQQLDDHQIQGQVINFAGSEDPELTFYFTIKSDTAIVTAQENEESVMLYFENAGQVNLQLGTSFISVEQAQLNLSRESDKNFSEVKQAAAKEWENYLNRIEVTHQNSEHTLTFYHNLYRSFLFPQKFYEIDKNGEKIHYDTLAKSIKTGVLYTNNGFWDTYKTVYPLFSLIAQEKFAEMLEGFLNSYRESGYLPKWLSPDERGLMPGTLIDAVIADASSKNIRPDLMPEFLEAMKKGATTSSGHSNYGRQGTLDYLKYGYVPLDYHESVNHTLDYAYSDFCISQVAKKLKDSESQRYRKQSRNFLNIFDNVTGFMCAKDKTGEFRPQFSANRWGQDYAEGSAWQSSFAVFHDVGGLIAAYGGKAAFQEKLTQLCNQAPTFKVGGYGFEIHEMSEMAAIEFGQLAISNQPSFHLPYLFNFIGKPENAQPLLKMLMTQCFDSSQTGFPGDEDNGSMAAWYIFNSLGFYPFCPGTAEYVLGMPLVEKATIHLSNGKTLEIKTSPNQPQQQFIDKISRNGVTYTKLYFDHEELMAGGDIKFDLGIVPRSRNYQQEDYPFSLTKK
ncbi:alpha-1,2-mannosidase [Lactococcus hodotermopsidis]|uniref:Alpha-1,2-mannosidase n=1 Tax=Pseudolactococcus hodotermopsidis TaxID=2709157 RepID=A0A6A0BCA3_9LACT|nr:GH92 family glycosyl hydrolase [Lactococcus hodotermopsidis]GFH42333.1 alpha-1,2-mannosidase [Lactococcus hodotermopsidis]